MVLARLSPPNIRYGSFHAAAGLLVPGSGARYLRQPEIEFGSLHLP
jgi:hypothetical protein